jgi:hypothetical protein
MFVLVLILTKELDTLSLKMQLPRSETTEQLDLVYYFAIVIGLAIGFGVTKFDIVS